MGCCSERPKAAARQYSEKPKIVNDVCNINEYVSNESDNDSDKSSFPSSN